MKKFLTLSIFTSILLSLSLPYSYAITDTNGGQNFKKESKLFKNKNKVEEETRILDYINYDWWRKQNDSLLEKYIELALEKNNDIKIAALNIEIAKNSVTIARADQLPSLSISPSPVLMKMPYQTKSQSSFSLPIIASYELDLFGKNWDKTKSSKKLLESTKFNTQTSDIAVVSMVGATYYNIVKFDELIKNQEKLVKERGEIFRLMKISNKEGITSTSDLILAEKNYVLAQNDLLDYKKYRQNALNALAVLIGDSAENSKNYERISYNGLNDNFNIPNEISSEIIVNRPDYKAAEKQLEAAGIDIRVAKKEFLPTIDILGLVTFIAQSGVDMGWNTAVAALGAGASLPIFTGFKRVANLKISKAKYQQLLQKYEKTNLTAIQEINDSLYNLKSDNDKYINNKKALEIQNKDYELTQSKFNKGVISKLDLLQHEETLLYVKQLTTTAKMDCFIDKISLYKATGAKI